MKQTAAAIEAAGSAGRAQDHGGATSLYAASARIFELLDLKMYHWAGHGLPPTSLYQCIESEYMRADKYDQLIADPTGYFIRYYLPCIWGALSPGQKAISTTSANTCWGFW